jgi:hypothetical protein
MTNRLFEKYLPKKGGLPEGARTTQRIFQSRHLRTGEKAGRLREHKGEKHVRKNFYELFKGVPGTGEVKVKSPALRAEELNHRAEEFADFTLHLINGCPLVFNPRRKAVINRVQPPKGGTKNIRRFLWGAAFEHSDYRRGNFFVSGISIFL